MGTGRAGVVLIGMRRAGKSTVGAELASGLGLPFVDLDRSIESAQGRRVADILVNDGEVEFRNMESEVLRRVVSGPAAVLAAGGGTPLREESRVALRAFGSVLYLQVGAQELARRLARDDDPGTRPVLRGRDAADEVRLLLEERDPLYAEVADAVVDADGDLATVVRRCRAALGVV